MLIVKYENKNQNFETQLATTHFFSCLRDNFFVADDSISRQIIWFLLPDNYHTKHIVLWLYIG